MKKSGIYCIENIKNGKKYIGQSVHLVRRRREHFLSLKKGISKNCHLQNAWNKYGENAFEFKILIYCEPFELTRYEQFFVDLYTPELLYNIKIECVDGSKHSEETKKKISNSMIGKKKDISHKRNLAKANLGKKHSEETKSKMSEAQSGEKNHNYGKKGRYFSEETRRKMSKSQSGEKNPNSKLTTEDVFEIRNLLKSEIKQIEIAKIYNVSSAVISYIKHGKYWKNLP